MLVQPSAALLAQLYGTKTLSGSVMLHRPGPELLLKHNLAMQKFKVPLTPAREVRQQSRLGVFLVAVVMPDDHGAGLEQITALPVRACPLLAKCFIGFKVSTQHLSWEINITG